MKKRVLLIFSLCFLTFFLTGQLFGQQLTRIAVVDLPKVYTAFFSVSRAVRDFEDRSAKVQADIDRMSREIAELRAKLEEANKEEDGPLAQRLEREILQKTDALKDFHANETAKLEEQRKNLSQSDSFLGEVFQELRILAESEGYVMVLNLRDNNSIVWYSPLVDLTDKLIHNLSTKSRR